MTHLYSCHEFLEQMTIVYEVTCVRHVFDIRHLSYGRCHMRQYVRQCGSVIPDESTHVARYCGEDPAFLELCEMVMVELTFCHRRYIWLPKRYVLVVLFFFWSL